MIEQEK